MFNEIMSALSTFRIVDAFDIALVTLILYEAIKLIRDTRAFQLAKGLVALVVVYGIVNIFGMQVSSFIFSKVISNILLILIVLFTPEIRHAIEQVGRNFFQGISIFRTGEEELVKEKRQGIIEIAKACQRMSDSKTGSLIIMENKTLLGDIISSGTVVDSSISHQLVGNIFFPNSPLHDGAVIVRDARIHAAGCVLPLTQNTDIPSDLGMRHRAAMGVTEQSDAIAIVTSEETGMISVCIGGEIERGLSESELRERLFEIFIPAEEEKSTGVQSLVNNLRRRLKK